MELINSIDETFKFENKEIRVIGSYQEPWFVAKDICDILELSNTTNALRNIPEKWMTLQNVKSSYNSQNMTLISEPAVYKLIMRSNKPIAQKFQEAVCEDILPSLRKKGEYKIKNIMDKNKQLEEEKLRIENKLLEKNEEIKKISREKEAEILRIEEETESKLIENTEENRLKMCKTIIQSYDNKNVLYLGFIGIINGKEAFKFGSSGRILKRIYREHNKTYEIFEFVYCIECEQHIKLENALKSDEKLKKYRFSHPFHVEGSDKITNVSELIYFDDNFNLESFKKLVIKLKNNIEMVDELRIHLEKTEHLKLELQIKQEEEKTKRIAKELEEQTKQKQLELEILQLKIKNTKAVREINDENMRTEIKRKEEELISKIESQTEVVKQIQVNNNKIFEERYENISPNLIDINIFENIYKPIQVTYQERNTFLYVAKINDMLYININSISEKSYPMDRWKRTAEIKNKILEYNFKLRDKKMLSIYSHKNKGTWVLFEFFCKNYFNWYGSIYNKVNNNTCYLNFGTFLEIQLPKLIDEYDLSTDKHFVKIKRGDSSFKVRANRETNFINVTDLFNNNNRDIRSFNKNSERKAYFLKNPEEHYVNGNEIIDEFGMKVTYCHPKLANVIVEWIYKKNENEEKQQVLNFINYFIDKL
uniref:Bro-N domain-containing protein n=1 Tax=viral metagenome TaxID=1070528 RepID=A0A6C0E1E9_9ZZZZ